MNISFNPSFRAKNQNIRRADDIIRHARNEFPASSPTYMDAFYTSHTSKDNEKKQKAINAIKAVSKKLTDVRLGIRTNSFWKHQEEEFLKLPIFQTLKAMKKEKVANCHEYSSLASAALAANRVYDIERANLDLEINIRHKKTGLIVYQHPVSLDHAVVLARMNPRDKEKIVVDGWLGFADSKSSAAEKYKQLLVDKDIEDEVKLHKSIFKSCESARRGYAIDFDKEYDLSTKIKYRVVETPNQITMIMVSSTARECYPELIMPEEG